MASRYFGTDPVLDVERLEIGDFETFADVVNERLGEPSVPLVGAVGPVALAPARDTGPRRAATVRVVGCVSRTLRSSTYFSKAVVVRLALVRDLDDLSADRGVPVAVLAASPRPFSIPSPCSKSPLKPRSRGGVYCMIYCIWENRIGGVFKTPCFISRADWIRTSDLLTPSQTRYQTAPRPELLVAARLRSHKRHTSKPASP